MKQKSDLTRSTDARLHTLVRDRTPARLLVGRSGTAYRTATQLDLRRDCAAARDAVARELDLQHDLGPEFVERWKLFEVCTRARTKAEYLLRPDLGRDFDEAARGEITAHGTTSADLQILIGDGLSATAVATQIPDLLPLLASAAEQCRWTVAQPFAIRHCRVGVMNVVGELLRPRVIVLLIGERPGMSVADSLSAYMAYEPSRRHTDADRNLISNIHARGVTADEAAARIIRLAAELMRARRSGSTIKEPATSAAPAIASNVE